MKGKPEAVTSQQRRRLSLKAYFPLCLLLPPRAIMFEQRFSIFASFINCLTSSSCDYLLYCYSVLYSTCKAIPFDISTLSPSLTHFSLTVSAYNKCRSCNRSLYTLSLALPFASWINLFFLYYRDVVIASIAVGNCQYTQAFTANTSMSQLK